MSNTNEINNWSNFNWTLNWIDHKNRTIFNKKVSHEENLSFFERNEKENALQRVVSGLKYSFNKKIVRPIKKE